MFVGVSCNLIPRLKTKCEITLKHTLVYPKFIERLRCACGNFEPQLDDKRICVCGRRRTRVKVLNPEYVRVFCIHNPEALWFGVTDQYIIDTGPDELAEPDLD